MNTQFIILSSFSFITFSMYPESRYKPALYTLGSNKVIEYSCYCITSLICKNRNIVAYRKKIKGLNSIDKNFTFSEKQNNFSYNQNANLNDQSTSKKKRHSRIIHIPDIKKIIFNNPRFTQ